MANYTELITRVIGDFDKIWTSLNTKGSAVADAKVEDSNGLVATAKYSTVIDKLTYIKNATGTINEAAYYAGTTVKNPLTVTKIEQSDGEFNIDATVNTAGYYASGAGVAASITATTVDLAAARVANEWVAGADGYSLEAQGYAIGSITAAKGTVTNTGSLIEGTFDESGEAQTAAVSTTVALEQHEDTNIEVDANSTFKVKVKGTATTAGAVSAKTTSVVTEGYVVPQDAPAAVVKTIDIDGSDEDFIEIGIKAGGVTVKTADNTTAKATLGGTILKTTADEGDYEITASITDLSLTADVEEGYVVAGTTVKVGTIATEGGSKYIAKGKSNNQTITVDGNLKVTAGSDLVDTTGKELTIAIDAAAQATADITEGYIKAAEAGKITVSGTKTVHIKESTASAKYVVNNYTVTDSSNITSPSSTGYAITVTPDILVTAAATPGWVDGASDIVVSKGENYASKASQTVYVKAGSLSVDAAPSFNATLVDRTDGKAGGTETEIGSIFLDAAPAEGDYFEVATAVSYEATEGYIAAQKGTPSVTKYMPKAIIELVEGGQGGEDYYQVTKAGYLPSGVLSQISTVQPSLASVAVTLSSTAGVLSTDIAQGKTAADYHQITVGKGVIDAGYISTSKGTVSGTAYIAKGKAEAKPTLGFVQDPTVVRVESGSGIVYQAKTTVKANSNLTVTPGYITAAEVDEVNVTKEQVSTYEIARATFGSTTHTTNASVVATGIIAGSASETGYVVAPRIDSCSTQFTVNTPGYISAADTDILKFENSGVEHDGEMTSFKIHAGTGIATQGEAVQGAITAAGDILSDNGAYSITIGGKVSKEITLDQGYYGQSESTLTVETAVSKTVKVAKASISASASGTNEISSTNVTLHDSKPSDQAEYYAITAAANVSVTPALTQAGYVATADEIVATGATPSDTVYVEGYKGTKRSGEATVEQHTAITVGQSATYELPAIDSIPEEEEKVVLDTAGKYSKKDTVVVLSADAMGTNVMAELARLEARLNGVINASVGA